MNSLNHVRPAVKPGRPPFRPLKARPTFAWSFLDNRVQVEIARRGRTAAYHVFPLATDLGGVAFRFHRRGGETHDVLLHGDESSCDCKGWTYTGGCVHLAAALELVNAGALEPAPGGAGGHDEESSGAF